VAVITGAGFDSIASELVKAMLEGGATVVVSLRTNRAAKAMDAECVMPALCCVQLRDASPFVVTGLRNCRCCVWVVSSCVPVVDRGMLLEQRAHLHQRSQQNNGLPSS
jgi:hypothetical protein